MTHNIFMCGKCVCVCVCGHLHVVALNVEVKTDTGYLSQLLSTLIFVQDMSLYLESLQEWTCHLSCPALGHRCIQTWLTFYVGARELKPCSHI